MKIQLSQRLQAMADFVPMGSRVADIGTDHGFLPCYLAQSGRACAVIACDVNAQPLQLAKKNIQACLLTSQVTTRLGNGLQVLKPDEVEVVTISGMGGPLITEILDGAAAVTASVTRFILQPNVAPDQVRRWAEQHGWHVEAEQLIQENGRFYPILVLEQGQAQPMNAVELQLGPKLLQMKHPLLPAYVQEERDKANKILVALEHSDSIESKKKAMLLKQQWHTIDEVIACL